MNNKFKNVCALGGFIIFAIIASFFLPKDDAFEIVQDTASSENLYVNETTDLADEKICVYILGAVHEPGIIEAPVDSRLYQIIELASGETEDADLSKVNLASIVKDGQKIVIPYKAINISGELYNMGVEENLVNINTASEEKLQSLSGIGASTARKIIQYREDVGSFLSIEDLKNVSGIGESKFNAIKDEITV